MLTKRQKQVLDYITQFIQHNGYAPCLREIAHNFGLSSASTVWEHIRNLESKGYIYAEKGIPRSISLPSVVHVQRGISNLRIYGRIAEGEHIEAIPIKESVCLALEWLSDRSDIFVLQVKGNSMVEDGIMDGDYIIMERRTEPQNGDLVVALLGNQCVTLKRYYRQSDCIQLQSINGKTKPICAKDPVIWGVVRAVLRKF